MNRREDQQPTIPFPIPLCLEESSFITPMFESKDGQILHWIRSLFFYRINGPPNQSLFRCIYLLLLSEGLSTDAKIEEAYNKFDYCWETIEFEKNEYFFPQIQFLKGLITSEEGQKRAEECIERFVNLSQKDVGDFARVRKLLHDEVEEFSILEFTFAKTEDSIEISKKILEKEKSYKGRSKGFFDLKISNASDDSNSINRQPLQKSFGNRTSYDNPLLTNTQQNVALRTMPLLKTFDNKTSLQTTNPLQKSFGYRTSYDNPPLTNTQQNVVPRTNLLGASQTSQPFKMNQSGLGYSSIKVDHPSKIPPNRRNYPVLFDIKGIYSKYQKLVTKKKKDIQIEITESFYQDFIQPDPQEIKNDVIGPLDQKRKIIRLETLLFLKEMETDIVELHSFLKVCKVGLQGSFSFLKEPSFADLLSRERKGNRGDLEENNIPNYKPLDDLFATLRTTRNVLCHPIPGCQEIEDNLLLSQEAKTLLEFYNQIPTDEKSEFLKKTWEKKSDFI